MTKVLLVYLVQLVIKEFKVPPEKKDQKDCRVRLVKKEKEVHKVRRETRVLLVHKVRQVTKVHKVHKVHKEKKDCQDFLVNKVTKDQQDCQVQLVILVLEVFKVPQVTKVHKVHKVHKEKEVHKVRKVHQVSGDHREFKDYKVNKAQEAQRVFQVRNAPITVQNVVTYDTVVKVENPDLKLKPGMTANVAIIVDRRDGALKVPNAALRFAPQNAEKTKGPGVFALLKAGALLIYPLDQKQVDQIEEALAARRMECVSPTSSAA